MDNKELQKKKVAQKAIEYVKPNTIVGVGTGSTVAYFIDELEKIKHDIEGAVSSSEDSSNKLKQAGIPVFDLNYAGELDLYVDGADEINPLKQLVKGGGAALTREKIIASASKTFICISDNSKLVEVLGSFPLPVEVIPMARSYVARELVKLGYSPIWRKDIVTDNGNYILDIHNIIIDEPHKIETKLNDIVGVVTVGLFANRGADIILLGQEDGSVIVKE